MHRSIQIRLALACLICGLLVGCQQSGEWQPTDKDQLRELVAGLSDVGRDPSRLKKLYASEEAVPDRRWLRKAKPLEFVLTDTRVDQDQAEIELDVENTFGEVQGHVTWTARRDGQQRWLLERTPLPK